MVTSSSASDTEHLQRLCKWVEEAKGAHIGSVQIAKRENDAAGRGLQATQTIKEGGVILRIPSTHLIKGKLVRRIESIADIMRCTEKDKLDERLPDTTTDSAAIILFLLAKICEGEDSFWKPWLDSLPHRFVTLLSADEQRVVDNLDGTPALPFVLQLRSEMREMYDDWFVPYAVRRFPNVYDVAKCTYDAFLYAHAILESRSFRLDEDTVLAPFADMANHAGSASTMCNARVRGWTTEDVPDDIGLELLAKRTCAAGDALCISYGALANWELLVHFGFAEKYNADDSIILQVDAEDVVTPPSSSSPSDEMDIHDDMRRLIVLHVHVKDFDAGFALSLAKPLPSGLVTGARILLSSAEELENGARKDYSSPVSLRNERAVIDWLRSVTEKLAPPDDIITDDDDDDDSGQHEMDEKRLWQFCRIYIESLKSIIHKTNEAITELEMVINRDLDDNEE